MIFKQTLEFGLPKVQKLWNQSWSCPYILLLGVGGRGIEEGKVKLNGPKSGGKTEALIFILAFWQRALLFYRLRTTESSYGAGRY